MYGHRYRKARDPVRSPLVKPVIGGLVVGSVTTSEYPLLYVFFLVGKQSLVYFTAAVIFVGCSHRQSKYDTRQKSRLFRLYCAFFQLNLSRIKNVVKACGNASTACADFKRV